MSSNAIETITDQTYEVDDGDTDGLRAEPLLSKLV
jgi:hypothetical protein